MKNPLLDQALSMATAINALRLKGAHIAGTSEGAEIHQRGKPVLLLTFAAAEAFANEVAEAEQWS